MPTLLDYEKLKKDFEILQFDNYKKDEEIKAHKKMCDELLQQLLDRKVIKTWYYNGEYHYEYSENYADNCDWKSKAEQFETELEKERKLNEYFKARFVLCSTCTDEDKKKCLMFTEHLCEGERCEQFVDLENLLEKATENGDIR